MATYTPNYQLHQWVPEDQFLRTDFNEDFKKIDTALGQKANTSALNSNVSSIQSSMDSQFSTVNSAITALQGRLQVAVGSYTGDGAASRTINLGFYPKAVLVEFYTGSRSGSGSGFYGGLALRDLKSGNPSKPTIEITTSGFKVFQDTGYAETNKNGSVYRYLAFY